MVAAAALGHTVLFAVFVLGMGLVSAVAPLAAQAFGARDPRMVRRALRVGLWAATLLGIPLSLVQLYGREILLFLGQTEEAATLAARYLFGLAWCLIPAWWFIALRGFMGAVNRPEPGLWITLVAIPANALLAYGLIYGEFGLPRLDLLGAGIATTIVNLGMCIAAIWVCYALRPFRKFQVMGRFWRPDWPLFRKLLVIGSPISGTFMLEYGVFAAAGIMMGWISTTALAAHQIALQIASIMFMVPFGISMAATVRVGHAVGRRDSAGTRSAGFVAISLGAVFMFAMTLLVIATRDMLPVVFLGTVTHGERPDRGARGDADDRRRQLLHLRRRAVDRGRCAARTERYPRAAAVLVHLLLGDRVHRLLRARLRARLRRARRLDRAIAVGHHLCGDAGDRVSTS